MPRLNRHSVRQSDESHPVFAAAHTASQSVNVRRFEPEAAESVAGLHESNHLRHEDWQTECAFSSFDRVHVSRLRMSRRCCDTAVHPHNPLPLPPLPVAPSRGGVVHTIKVCTKCETGRVYMHSREMSTAPSPSLPPPPP
ncbi:unnamed protein product, partial [Protopolystoma xenopodis]